MTRLFHPILALIASSTDRELGWYIEYLKAENEILRACIPGQVHTKLTERKRRLKLGKVLGKAIEELISIVAPSPTGFEKLTNSNLNTLLKIPASVAASPISIRDHFVSRQAEGDCVSRLRFTGT